MPKVAAVIAPTQAAETPSATAAAPIRETCGITFEELATRMSA
jgi:hypothetical protein